MMKIPFLLNGRQIGTLAAAYVNGLQSEGVSASKLLLF